MRIFCYFLFVFNAFVNPIFCYANDRLDWQIVLSKSLHRAPDAALTLMRDRYAALPAGSEKLYISSLIYSFMAERNQHYYANQTSVNSPYQNAESELIDSLIAEQQQDFKIAEKGYLNLYQTMKKLKDAEGEFLFEYHLCRLYNEYGQYFKGRVYCDQLSHRINDTNNHLIPKFQTLQVIARNQESLGHYHLALLNYKKVIDQLPDSEDPTSILNDVGLLFCTLGQYDKALDYLYRALTLNIENNSQTGIAQVEQNLGDVYFHMKDFNKSILHFNKARLILLDNGDLSGLAYVQLGLGRSYTESGEFHNGLSHLLKALDYAVNNQDTSLKTQIYLALSGSYLAKQYLKQANYYALKAKSLAEETQNNRTLTLAFRQLALISDQTENYQQALSYYRSYVDNEIEVRNSEHREAFEALDLSKQKMEHQSAHNDLVIKNNQLSDKLSQLHNQQMILLAVVLVFLATILTLQRKNYVLKNHIGIDCLTSALHRPAFIQKVQNLKPVSNQNYRNLVMLFDIENLKHINQEFGYEQGNIVLKSISATIENQLTKNDFWGRLGGGKFVVVMVNIELDEAQYKVENLYHSLNMIPHNETIKEPINPMINATYLATTTDMNSFDKLYTILDRALNHSKKFAKYSITNASEYSADFGPSSPY